MNDDLSSRCNIARWQRWGKRQDRTVAKQGIGPEVGPRSDRSGNIGDRRGSKVCRGLVCALILLFILIGVYPLSSPFASPPSPTGAAKVNPDETAPETRLWSIEGIGFERPFGRERVVVALSGKTVLGLPRPSLLAVEDRAESVLLKMEDTYVAGHLRRPWGEAFGGNVVRVIPHQVIVDGKHWVHLVVDLKEKVPYAVRREGGNVLLEFNVAALVQKKAPDPVGAAVAQRKEPPVARDAPGPPPRDVPPGIKASAPQLISLDFQEASVKSVLRLLAEMGGVNIVSGEDVKGLVTIHLRNVTWEQALDVILDVRQLARRRIDDVITVMTVERMQKEEAERAVVLEAKRRAELERQRLAMEQERQRLLLEKERLDLETRAQTERERPVVKAVEPGAEVFVDLDIRRVFQLLAEERRRQGEKLSIVATDDVRGTLTADLREVPWEQRLQTILDIRGLAKRRVGDVITVMTVERMRKDEAERAVVLEAKWRADQERQRLALEQERQRLLLEKERLDLETRVQAERERPVVKVVEPGAEVFVDMDIRRVFQLLAEERRRQGERLSIVATDDVRGALTADLREVPWDQRLQTILDIRGLAKRRVGDVITVMTVERMRKEEAERTAAELVRRKTEQEYRERELKMAAEQMKLEQARRKDALVLARPPLVTRVVPISYASPKFLQENLQDLLLKDAQEGIPQGSIRVDEHSNSLIVQAVKEDMARMLALIARLDKPVSQVSIRANIVETSRDTARSLGVMWGGVYGTTVDGRNLIATPGGKGQIPGIGGAPWATVPPGQAFTGGYLPAFGSRGIGGQGFGVNFPAMGLTDVASATLGLMFGTIGGNILELQLQALQQEGKLNIVSSPQITTLDNQMAFTENGERIPYVTFDRDGRPEVRFQDAVLRLEITPSIIDDTSLKMKVVVKKDEVDIIRTVAGNPFIIRKQTETNLTVRDGETIVISGLARQRKIEGTRGVPWLQNIPVLGWLFKAEDRDETMEEVVIFITPNILRARVETGIQTGS